MFSEARSHASACRRRERHSPGLMLAPAYRLLAPAFMQAPNSLPRDRDAHYPCVEPAAPEFHRIKPYAVHRLWLLASAMRVRIGVHKGAVDAVDDADLATRIPRQAGVSHRMDVLCSH